MSNPLVSAGVQRKRLTLLFRQANSASVGATIAALGVAAVFLSANQSAAPLTWLAAVLLATALRFRLYRRFFTSPVDAWSEDRWLTRHGWTALLIGLAWGATPLVPIPDNHAVVQQTQILIPGFLLMAAITAYAVYFSQYLVLWAAVVTMTVASRLVTGGAAAIPEIMLFCLFAPILLLTASRFSESLLDSSMTKDEAERLVERLTAARQELNQRKAELARQQDLIAQEDELAKHVFQQLTLGGSCDLPGIHTWNQPMGSLSGDLTQTARGPAGQAYVLLADFTGHGLPAALGALPASSVFLAMAAKGLPLDAIVAELNAKLYQLLPIGYFCCAVLLEVAPDHRRLRLWNGGLPAVLVRREGEGVFEHVESHSVPLGVVGDGGFSAETRELRLEPGDLVYAYTDGLTEAENTDGEMWGNARLERFLATLDRRGPRLPALIDAVLEHVHLAPPSDDISVVEVEALRQPDSKACSGVDAA